MGRAVAYCRASTCGATVVNERGKRRATWYRWEDLPREEVNDRLSRRLITADRIMLAHVYLKKGCVCPRTCRTRRTRWKIRSTWTCSRRHVRTGSTRPTRTYGGSPHPLSPSPLMRRGGTRD